MEKLINDFSVGLFFWQTLLFLVLVFFLRKFAWKPILEAVEGREEGIKNALDAADKAKADMEALNADNERILAEAKAVNNNLEIVCEYGLSGLSLRQTVKLKTMSN